MQTVKRTSSRPLVAAAASRPLFAAASRTLFAAGLLLFLTAGIFAMPVPLKSDAEGWLEISAGYTYAFPVNGQGRGGHNLCFNISILNTDFWGGGATLKFGETILELTMNIQKRFLTDTEIGIPVYLKVGLVSPGADEKMHFGFGIESGLNYFFNERIDGELQQEDNQVEYNYTFLEGLVGLFASCPIFRKGPFVPGADAAPRFLLIPAGTVSVGYATTPYPFSGTYYSY